MKIIDGVYGYIWKSVFENNSNMYYFAEPLNMLIDPGLNNYVDVRIEEMKKDKLDPEAIKYIVNTHGHPDHYTGSEFFSNKNIPIAIHKDETEFISKIGPMFFDMMGMQEPKIDFNVLLEKGKWQVEGTELEVYLTPGHSPASVCIYWREKKTLACGDLIFQGSIGRVDFPGGDAELLKDSIKRMSELDIELLLPGHMGFIKGKEEVKKNFDYIINQYLPML
jgi:hydroxyacylglutathione hydrolase